MRGSYGTCHKDTYQTVLQSCNGAQFIITLDFLKVSSILSLCLKVIFKLSSKFGVFVKINFLSSSILHNISYEK